MMKKVISFLFVFILMPAAVAMAAPERAGHWDVGVNVAGAISTDSDTDAGVQVAGSISYGVNEWLAIGFSGGWQRHDIDGVSENGVTIGDSQLTGVPLFADFIFRVPTGDQPYTPYAVVGLGTVIWDLSDISADYLGTSIDTSTEVESSLAVKLGGGVDWFINDNWILNLEGAYVIDRSDVTATATAAGASASATESVKLDYWTVGGGLKHRF